MFVSSHLMSEMQLTVDRPIVIGRGKLLADAPVDEFIAGHSRTSVSVRVPVPDALRALGATTESDRDELIVHDLSVSRVGDLVHELGIRVHGLTERTASLEQAYMELTAASVEYGTEVAV